MDVQAFFNRLWNRISIQEKLGFFCTFLGGLILNLFVFANKMGNHDDIIDEFSYNDSFDISCGRWMWIPLRKIATYYDMPMIKGLLACLLLAFSVMMIVKIFSISENVFVIVLSLTFASFPVNACFFSYLSISEIYYFAIFFTILAVYMTSIPLRHISIYVKTDDKTGAPGDGSAADCGNIRGARCRGKSNSLCMIFLCMSAASILIALALGTYQSMLCLYVSVVFVMAFAKLWDSCTEIKKWFTKYILFAVPCVCGYFIYYIVTKILTTRNGISLRTYAGTDQMFKFSPSLLGKSIANNYYEMYRYFFSDDYVNRKLFMIANVILLLTVLAIVLGRIFYLVRKKRFGNALILMALTILSPIFIDMIEVMMNDKSSAHVLMRYSNVIFYVLAVMAVTRGNPIVQLSSDEAVQAISGDGVAYVSSNKKIKCFSSYFRQTLQWIALLGLTVIIYLQALTSNQLYQRMYYNAKGMDGVAVTLVSQLSSLEGWSVDEPVYFYGFNNFFNGNYESATPFASDLPPYSWIGTDNYDWYSTEHLINYISRNQHIKLTACDDAEGTIEESEELANMPAFPDNGSVKRINGVVVVKFN